MFFRDSETNENTIIWLLTVSLADWLFKEDTTCSKSRCKRVWDGFFFSFREVCSKTFFVNHFREFISRISFTPAWSSDSLTDKRTFLVVSNHTSNPDERRQLNRSAAKQSDSAERLHATNFKNSFVFSQFHDYTNTSFTHFPKSSIIRKRLNDLNALRFSSEMIIT